MRRVRLHEKNDDLKVAGSERWESIKKKLEGVFQDREYACKKCGF